MLTVPVMQRALTERSVARCCCRTRPCSLRPSPRASLALLGEEVEGPEWKEVGEMKGKIRGRRRLALVRMP